MTIRCHFDGKVFVPDEPVDLPDGQPADVSVEPLAVEFTGGRGATMADLLKSLPDWSSSDFGGESDAPVLAEELRRQSSQLNSEKQRAMDQLHKHWDSQGVNENGDQGIG